MQLEQFDLARENFTKAYDYSVMAKDSSGIVIASSLVGRALTELDQFDQAFRWLDMGKINRAGVLDLASAVKVHQLGYFFDQVSSEWMEKHNYEQKDSLAKHHYISSSNWFNENPEVFLSEAADCYLDYAEYAVNKSQLTLANSYLEKIEGIQRLELGLNQVKRTRRFYLQARVFESLGDTEELCVYIGHADELVNSLDPWPHYLRLHIKSTLGNCFFYRQEWSKAAKIYREIFDLESRQSMPNTSFQITGAGMAAAAFAEMGDTSASYYLSKALRISYSADSDPYYLSFLHVKLGQDLQSRGKMQRAQIEFDLAAEHFAIIADTVGLSKVMLYSSDLAILQDDPYSALNYVNQALELMRISQQELPTLWDLANRNIDDFFDPMIAKVGILQSLYEKTEDAQALFEALELTQWIDRLAQQNRNGNYSEATKVIVSDHFHKAANNALRILTLLQEIEPDPNYVEIAFNFMERNRYSQFYRDYERFKTQKSLGIPDSIEQRFRALRADLLRLDLKVNDAKGSNGVTIRDSLIKQRRLLKSFQAQVSNRYPGYFKMYSDSMKSLTQMRAQLPDDIQVMEYFWGSSDLYLLSMTSDTVILARCPLFEFEAELKDLLAWISTSYPPDKLDSRFDFINSSYALFQTLLQPYLVEGKKRVLIAPDGHLSFLPFEVLVTNRSSRNLIEADYLLQKYIVQYAYSCNLHFDQGDEVLELKPKILAMSFSDESTSDESGDSRELPFSGVEVQNINSRFSSKRVRVLKGKDASKKAFEMLAPEHNIVHLALHGIADTRRAHNSHLLFPTGDSAKNENKLFSYELYQQPLNLNLAVLSACETGIGKSYAGEGIFSISRGFATAGTRAQVLSLWKANDQVTAFLMDHFYRMMSKGHSTARALQEAKLAYLEKAGPISASPYYWAGFVLIGDDSVLFEQSRSNLIILFIVVMAAICMLILWTRNRSME